jgi:hypothetical protein
LSTNEVFCVIQDRQGRLWFGTQEGGVSCYTPQAQTWQTFTTSDGLGNNTVFHIHEDQTGHLWFATYGGGVSCYNPLDQTWQTFTTAEGLVNDVVYGTLSDEYGTLWFATNQGVCRLNLETRHFIGFDRSDGLANDECNGGAVYRDQAGRLWFGTQGGVSVLQPAHIPLTIPPCQVYLTGLKIMGQDTPLTPEMVIEDTDYDLIFAYGAIEFTKADKVRYHTQLLGLEKTWSEPNAQRLARYTNLHPGDYTFQVQARNWGGQWSQIAAFSFTIIRNREVQAREEALEQERLERELLHLEHQRKSEELEQARQLQLSLLPTTPPRLPYLEIVAFQNTATEVGGDYYDFLPQADGSLFVAFGDATGHGVSAGLMVTATKMGVLTLWGTEVTQGISLLNSSLIRLNLGQGLNMALNVLHLWPDPATQTIQVEICGG